MKLAFAFVAAAASLTATVAAAEPTQKELETRAADLEKKLAGQGYTVVITAPFVVVGDGGAKEVKHIANGFLYDESTMMEKDFFAKRPEKLIEVWLFHNERSFRAGAKKFFNDEPDTPYGYYSPDASALIMNVNGLGTLSHELVHPYMEANFGEPASWFNEGLASLFERPSERKGHIIGLPNWRLPNLKKEIRDKSLPSLTKLVATSRDEFYTASWDAYAQARYLIYYLQEHGKLKAFYDAALADKKDPTAKTALESVLGEDLDAFDPKWRKWVLAIQGDNR
ncbi:MAG: DUF1570 domain-containing protein [Deltaproteobacteria bacterium]